MLGGNRGVQAEISLLASCSYDNDPGSSRSYRKNIDQKERICITLKTKNRLKTTAYWNVFTFDQKIRSAFIFLISKNDLIRVNGQL